ncbi:MAG: histidine kinase dimerization/phospho-acceptor domain-containing protein, partial [Deltaproteobacteria bacterium]
MLALYAGDVRMKRRGLIEVGEALLIVAAASGLRALLFVLFAHAGRDIPYATYFPAVMVAAVLGGLRAGLLATALSALVCYFWVQQRQLSLAEGLALSLFLLSGAFIAGAMAWARRASARAEQAEKANRSKDAFLANVSHELRTPLNAVLGFSRQLRDSPDVTERQAPILEIITRSGEHLLEVINNVLDVAKVASGR